MISKGVIVLALLQLGALGYGILFTAAFLKPGVQFFEINPQLTPPIGFVKALMFRDYGLILSLVIVGWTAAAGYYSSPFSNRDIDDRYILGSGVVLLGLFFLMGTYFAVMATTPSWSF